MDGSHRRWPGVVATSCRKLLPGMPRTSSRASSTKISSDYRSYLRDEAGIIESKAANTPIETEPLAQTGK